MTRRQDRAELREDLKNLERQDLEDVVKVQTYVIGVTMGQRPFEHPNSPQIHQGSRYLPNEREIDFAHRSRSTLYSNFFRFMIVGALTPYLTLRALSILQKRFIPTQRYVIWSSIGGGFGGMYGMTLGRMSSARDYLRLEGSPLATEARYQLWKINPSHPFLRGFEHETMDWNSNDYKYRDKSEVTNDTYYDEYNEYKNKDRESINDIDDVTKRKRDRFYQGRNRVNNNSLNDGYDDMSDFFETANGNSPNDDASEFFESDTTQKWD